MNVAVCGSGALAIEIALGLNEIGANYTFFYQSQVGGTIRLLAEKLPYQSMEYPFFKITSARGRNILSDLNLVEWSSIKLNSIPTIKEYWDLYLHPLILHSKAISEHKKKAKILRVHKKFLLPSEVPKIGRTRLVDLFRVVFSLDKTDHFIKKIYHEEEMMDENNPFLEESDQIAEHCLDFDFVVDARGSFQVVNSLGPSRSKAVGEDWVKAQQKIFYGLDFFTSCEQFLKMDQLALVGNSLFSFYTIQWLYQSNWFLPHRQLHWIFEESNEEIDSKLKVIFKKLGPMSKDWEESYQQKLQEWNDLDDFVKVKIKKPSPSKVPLVIYQGFSATNVDKMTDQAQVFLTVEKPEFRGEEALKTLGVDAVVVANGFSIDKSIFQGLLLRYNDGLEYCLSPVGTHPEPGFYSLGPNIKYQNLNMHNGINLVQAILQDMLKFFTKK